MHKKNNAFSQLYVDVFNKVLQFEELSVGVYTGKKLTIGEMHTLEGIGIDTTRTMTELAGIMNVTVSTLTVTIDRLVRKGYVQRTRSDKDRRVVWISLTREGKVMLKMHLRMHLRMVNEALEGLDEAQLETLSLIGNQILTYFTDEYDKLLQKEREHKSLEA